MFITILADPLSGVWSLQPRGQGGAVALRPFIERLDGRLALGTQLIWVLLEPGSVLDRDQDGQWLVVSFDEEALTRRRLVQDAPQGAP